MFLWLFVVGFWFWWVLTGGFVVFATYRFVSVRLTLGFVLVWVMLAYLVLFCATLCVW